MGVPGKSPWIFPDFGEVISVVSPFDRSGFLPTWWLEDSSLGVWGSLDTPQINSQVNWSNYSDLTPNGGLVREIPLFQGNLGW